MREFLETDLNSFDSAERDAIHGARRDRDETPQDTAPARRVRTRAAASGNRRQNRRRAAHAATRPELEETKTTTEQLPGTDSLDLFLRRARAHPLLTAAEEVELAKRIERGDLAAKERMINSNLRLVVSQARRYQGHGLPMEDLVQEGMLGLIRAVEKFDWRKGFRFSTYGTLWIRQAIQRGLENTSRTVRLPVHMSQRARKVARLTRELTVKLGHEPSNEELASVLDLTIEEIEEIKAADQAPSSLDRTVGEDGDTTFGELLPADQLSTEDEVVDSWQFDTLESAVAELPEQERTVIQLRFGRNRDGK